MWSRRQTDFFSPLFCFFFKLGLGRAYALAFAERGASVVGKFYVNWLDLDSNLCFSHSLRSMVHALLGSNLCYLMVLCLIFGYSKFASKLYFPMKQVPWVCPRACLCWKASLNPIISWTGISSMHTNLYRELWSQSVLSYVNTVQKFLIWLFENVNMLSSRTSSQERRYWNVMQYQ